MINISLNTANINAVSISSPEFQVWQHLEDHWNKTQLHTLADVPTGPVAHSYKHMIDNNGPIYPFNLADESIDDTGSIWTLFSPTGIYIMVYRIANTCRTRDILLILFWCQPAILACWPFQSGSSWHTIVDDDVEAGPIYRSDGKADSLL